MEEGSSEDFAMKAGKWYLKLKDTFRK